MRNHKRWTQDEDIVVLDQVRRHADNLSVAFQKASEILERKPSAVKVRWYSVLSKKENNICFATLSDNKKVANRKVVKHREDTSTTTTAPEVESWWEKFLSWFK